MPRLADPPGFEASNDIPSPEINDLFLSGGALGGTGAEAEKLKQIYSKRGMEIARGQLGQIFQTAFTLYMFVGNQLSLYSIFFLLTMGTGPIKNIFNLSNVFDPITIPGVTHTNAKIVYIAINLAGVGVFLYKLKSMGLLPITSSDWISLLPTQIPSEYSSLAT